MTLLATLLATGLVAPLIDAARFSGPIQQAIEESLGRKIQFSAIHLSLFSGPGFSLENVSISEDPRYGLEPFAWVPNLQAHLRIDKLLRGQIRLSSLRLEGPALNLVKRSDGTWNVVELVQRLSAPRRMPLNFFPTFEVADGRIDFKFGSRKTTFYVLNADLAIYPERSGKLSVQFSGSPARTDRAGNGFGHLRGTADWYRNSVEPEATQLQADIALDNSNLSELTTLVQGEDIGVHGSISGHARVAGPIESLRVTGDLTLGDVHRWDLLPATGENWRIAYEGDIDWAAHRMNVHTLAAAQGEPNPVAVDLNVDEFLTHPRWSLVAKLDHAPLDKLLPVGRRMGLSLPEDIKVTGSVDGSIGYSNAAGVSGNVAISDASATLSNVPPLRTGALTATLFPDRIHFEPAVIDTTEGSLRAGGDYYLSPQRSAATLSVTGFSIDVLKSTIDAWFGTPPALAVLKGGRIDGTFNYLHQQPAAPAWSGQFQFADATVQPEGLGVPLSKAGGQVQFDATTLDLTRFASKLGQQDIRGSYRYSADAKRPERLRVEMAAADLGDLESALDPALTTRGLLARLHVTSRSMPGWLASRNMEGELAVGAFSIGGIALGPMTSHFIWQGANLQISQVKINLPEGLIRARGLVNLASYAPKSRFTAQVAGFPWRGGMLSADGTFVTSGVGADSLQNLHANGTFTGADVNFSADDAFSKISGQFDFSFASGWPDLKVSGIQASDGMEAWNGNGSSRSDGKLIIDLEHAGRQRRVISTLLPETATTVSSIAPFR